MMKMKFAAAALALVGSFSAAADSKLSDYKKTIENETITTCNAHLAASPDILGTPMNDRAFGFFLALGSERYPSSPNEFQERMSSKAVIISRAYAEVTRSLRQGNSTSFDSFISTYKANLARCEGIFENSPK